jgi:hypothetical protein
MFPEWFFPMLVSAIALGSFGRFYILEYRRERFIRDYTWPPQLLEKLERHHAGFTRKESALVGNGLRQFFLAYLGGGFRQVSMPSEVVDDLWHEFILYTRDYQVFCSQAFGRFLHHTPAVRLSPNFKSSNEGLRRVWFQCCKQENISPTNPSRLPLLFALDTKFKIANGYVYAPDCEELRRNGSYGGQCGGDFSSSTVDGGTDGFGDGDGGGDAGDGGDGGGCGGGCGGD